MAGLPEPELTGDVVLVTIKWTGGEYGDPKSISVLGPMVAAAKALALIKPEINYAMVKSWVLEALKQHTNSYVDKHLHVGLSLKDAPASDGYIALKFKPTYGPHEVLKFVNSLKKSGWTMMSVTSPQSISAGGSTMEKQYWASPDDTSPPPPYHQVKDK